MAWRRWCASWRRRHIGISRRASDLCSSALTRVFKEIGAGSHFFLPSRSSKWRADRSLTPAAYTSLGRARELTVEGAAHVFMFGIWTTPVWTFIPCVFPAAIARSDWTGLLSVPAATARWCRSGGLWRRAVLFRVVWFMWRHRLRGLLRSEIMVHFMNVWICYVYVVSSEVSARPLRVDERRGLPRQRRRSRWLLRTLSPIGHGQILDRGLSQVDFLPVYAHGVASFTCGFSETNWIRILVHVPPQLLLHSLSGSGRGRGQLNLRGRQVRNSIPFIFPPRRSIVLHPPLPCRLLTSAPRWPLPCRLLTSAPRWHGTPVHNPDLKPAWQVIEPNWITWLQCNLEGWIVRKVEALDGGSVWR